MMQQVEENALITRLSSLLPHRPSQLNGVQESDAELVRLPGNNQILAVTTDAIVEEIESGLYTDPYLVGWMTVMANLSDLAAVGADPVGILVAETLRRDAAETDIAALQTGIRDACLRTGTPVLGGDTNFSDRLHTAGTAIGTITDGSPLMRVRCKPGEVLFCTGPLGTGNAYAAVQMMKHVRSDFPPFLPVARIQEGLSLRTCASICMDTSDGVLATLDQLGRLNKCGFHVDKGWESHIAPGALNIAEMAGMSPWMLLAGPHGEFELLFTVPPHKIPALQNAAHQAHWIPVRLGVVTESPGISIADWGTLNPDDLASVRNHPLGCKSDIPQYLRYLAELEERCRTSTKA
jgi:thiamine-monophosphate kinase